MLLQEKDQEVFKRWVLPKLETISDADAEVLADYVIALVVANDSEANVKRNCLESLSDFLQDYTEPFVNDVIQVLKDKSYVPGKTVKSGAERSAPIPSIVGTDNYEYEPHPSRATNTPPPGAPKGPAVNRAPTASHRLPDRPTGPSPSHNAQQDGTQSSRKRKLVERETSQSREGHDTNHGRNAGGNRLSKQAARRSGRNTRGGAIEAPQAFAGFAAMPNLPNFPPPPPGPPPFDLSDPMAMFAMAAAFGVSLPGMPPLPFANPQGNGSNQEGPKLPCEDYHTKGFCKLGTLCPYEHGGALAVPANDVPEYDPEHASLAVQPSSGINGQGAHRKGARTRAPFSQPGPSYDRSNTTLVVEQIPPEHFSEDDVRGFFAQFGAIVELRMHTHKRLAVIKFEDHLAASRAYNSPKAVFENRFVKVYWYKPDSVPGSSKESFNNIKMEGAPETEEKLDPEEIAARQAEAQKTFEERRRKAEEAEARAEEVKRQLEEKYEEMRKVRQQLAELSGDSDGHKEAEFSQTLATLQAEAEGLFAQHEPGAPPARGRGGYRGGWRGRGYTTFAPRGVPYPRGRGYTPFRGAYRGRGFPGAPFHTNRSSVKRLDNRPKRLAIAKIEANSSRDEALRQYLLNVPDCTSIERHPEQTDTLIITFKERYQAESFLDESLKIPNVGKLELAWVPNDAFGGIKPEQTDKDAEASDEDDSSSMVEEKENKADATVKVEQQEPDADADMDVADDVDQWL